VPDQFSSADGSPFNLADPSGIGPGKLSLGTAEGLPAAFGDPPPKIVAAGIASGEAVGQPIISANPLIVAAGIASSEAVGQPIIGVPTTHTIVAAGIASSEAVGQPIIGVPTTHTIVCAGIASSEEVGRPIIGGPPPPRGSVRPPDIDLERLLAKLRAQALQEDGELLLFAASLVCAAE
jgi:hypothetical protein